MEKKLENRPKNKVLRLYNSPLLGGAWWRLKVCMHAAFYPVFCDFVIVGPLHVLRFG